MDENLISSTVTNGNVNALYGGEPGGLLLSRLLHYHS